MARINRNQLLQLQGQLTEKHVKKAQDISADQDRHQIQIRGMGGQGPPTDEDRPTGAGTAVDGGGVLSRASSRRPPDR